MPRSGSRPSTSETKRSRRTRRGSSTGRTRRSLTSSGRCDPFTRTRRRALPRANQSRSPRRRRRSFTAVSPMAAQCGFDRIAGARVWRRSCRGSREPMLTLAGTMPTPGGWWSPRCTPRASFARTDPMRSRKPFSCASFPRRTPRAPHVDGKGRHALRHRGYRRSGDRRQLPAHRDAEYVQVTIGATPGHEQPVVAHAQRRPRGSDGRADRLQPEATPRECSTVAVGHPATVLLVGYVVCVAADHGEGLAWLHHLDAASEVLEYQARGARELA